MSYFSPPPSKGALINTIYYTMPTQTVTMTIASPCVITCTGVGKSAPQEGSPVQFTTTGSLPTGIVASTTYYVVNVSGQTFQIAETKGGTPINTSGAQSGTHTGKSAPYEKAINSPSFIKVSGVGGGSGGNYSSEHAGSSGGFGLKQIAEADLSSSETVTVGLGGLGASTGGAGEASSFGSHMTMNGGGSGTSGVGGTVTGADFSIDGANARPGRFAGAPSAMGPGGHGSSSSATDAPQNSGGGGGSSAGVSGDGGSGLIIVEEYS